MIQQTSAKGRIGIEIFDENHEQKKLLFTKDEWKQIYENIKLEMPDIADNDYYYDQIVLNLKREAKYLNEKLEMLRNNHDMQGYIATLKSLRETLNLIKEYDWKLMYSEYKAETTKIEEIERELNRLGKTIKNKDGSYKDTHEAIKIISSIWGNITKETFNFLFAKTYVPQIAVWEQNHEGQIRNHKTWRILDNLGFKINKDGSVYISY